MGTEYAVLPIPAIERHTERFAAGAVTFGVEYRLLNEVMDEYENVSDVTVHIDPENDEQGSACDQLPLRSDLIEKLQGQWADLEPVAYQASGVGKTPLQVAREDGRDALARLLVAAGAKV